MLASPAPQLPSITAAFEVTGVDQPERPDAKKTIRIFIGSDALRMHSADLLLSRNPDDALRQRPRQALGPVRPARG